MAASASSAAAPHSKLFSDRVNDPAEWGENELELYVPIAADLTEFRDRHPELATRFFDAQFTEVQADPLEVLGRLYGQFGIDLTTARRSVVEDWVRHDRQGWSSGLQHSGAGQRRARAAVVRRLPRAFQHHGLD